MKSALKKFSCSKFWEYLGPSFSKCWAITGFTILIFVVVYWIYGGLSAFFSLVFIIIVILYHIQDIMLYRPEDSLQSRYYVQIPPVVGLPYENIFIRSIDGTLIHLYFIPQVSEKLPTAPTLVFFHGNAGNIGHRLQNASGFYHNLHCNILMLEYRGYGLSSGRPSEDGLSMDARAAIDYLSSRKDINHRQIIVFGRSLGGAVAIDLAARPEYSSKIWCLILENTFTSIPDMAIALFQWRFLKSIPLFFYKNKFMSRWKVARVNNPTLFISGLSDALVPPTMMTDLFNRCGSLHKQLLHVKGGTHNDTWTFPGYYTNISTFLSATAEFKPDPPVLVSSIKDV